MKKSRRRTGKSQKATRDIVVIGASMGGMEAICTLLEGLPAHFPASVFVVQHVGSASMLAEIFARCGSLQVVSPHDGARINEGCVYVAPSNHHLLVNDGHIELSKEARENRHRPSIDALFRSAARSHRSRVIAVILSGSLDDGAGGAFAVKTRGGVVVVQDPKEAAVPDMPCATMRAVKVDHCVPLKSMPA